MKYIKAILLAVAVVLIGYLYIHFFSYIHSKKVEGVIVRVERVDLNVALMQEPNAKVNPQMFSFAVAIKDKAGEIFTASAEDRQWAVATAGQCVEARFYPYPPWNLDKAGTYYNARLERLFECPN